MIRRLAGGVAGSGRLQHRLMLIVVVGALLFSAAAAGIAFLLAERRALAVSRDAIANLTTAVEKTLAIGAYAKDAVLLNEIVRGLGGHGLVRLAEVRAADGRVLASYGTAPDGPAQPAALAERALQSPFDASERVGTLRLQLDMGRVAGLARNEALLLGSLMVGQGVLVAWLLYAVVAWLVSGPIVRLARALPGMEPGSPRRLDKPAYHHDDEIGLLVDATNALLDDHGAALQRERTLRAEVEAMEAQYRQIFDSSSAGIFVLDADGRLINSNPTVSQVLGMSREQLRGLLQDNFLKQVFERPEKVQRMVDEAIRSGRTVSADLELLQAYGQERWVHCLISVQARRQLAQRTVEGVIYDVTERKSSERRVRHRAEHDALTGLKNRAATQAAIESMLAEAMSTGGSAALLCMDLDGFKRINDQLGHRAGDQVLTICAQRMTSCVRSDTDIVGRLGGDEFIIGLRGMAADDPALSRTASALLEALRRPMVLDDGERVAVGGSIGVACAPCHATSYASLLEAADLAMYEVKRSGKNAFAMAATRAAVNPRDVDGSRQQAATETVSPAVDGPRAFELTNF